MTPREMVRKAISSARVNLARVEAGGAEHERETRKAPEVTKIIEDLVLVHEWAMDPEADVDTVRALRNIHERLGSTPASLTREAYRLTDEAVDELLYRGRSYT